MATLVLLILIITETGFVTFEIISKVGKHEWALRRVIVNAVEMVTYLLMVLLPGVDMGFRWRGLFVILILRLLVAGLLCIKKPKEDKKKNVAIMVLSAILSIVLISSSMVPAFLIKDYKGLPVSGPYKVIESDIILVDASRVETFETDGSKREVPAHFFYPENINELEEKSLPLIVFSHGAFGYYQSNMSTYMELASNGYVVVSLDHPYHSFFTKDTDGKTITVDPNFFQTAMNVGNSDVSESEVYDITSKWMELREDDVNFVLDTIIEASETNELGDEWFLSDANEDMICDIIKHIDITRIGVIGHSLGGATAVNVGRREDVLAVVDLDGTMIGEETGVKDGIIQVDETPYDTPLLSIDNDEHHFSRIECEETGVVYANNIILDNATEGFETYVEGSGHMNFTDLPLISPTLASLLGTGDVDSEECMMKINSITLKFFDCYLKGSGDFAVDEKI